MYMYIYSYIYNKSGACGKDFSARCGKSRDSPERAEKCFPHAPVKTTANGGFLPEKQCGKMEF